MSDKNTGRYSRQEILAEIGVSGQKKLSAARVLVVGAGGLGCPAMQYLAGAGIGTIGIIDHDNVDISNLQRQVLYDTADAGKPKAAIAKERLLRLNPHITVNAYVQELTAENAISLFSGYDVIIDGTDNFPARFLINDAAVKLGKPVIYGAIQNFEGQVSVFDSVRGPCYRCLHPEPPQGLVLNCAESGVMGPLAGIVGTMQAMETIKILAGHSSFSPLIGKLWLVDTRSMETGLIAIPRNKNCSVCSCAPAQITLKNCSPVCSAAMTKEICFDDVMLDNAVLVDVRERSEWEEGHIKGAKHFPLSSLQKDAKAFAGVADNKNIVLYCQKGARSKKAAEILLSEGFLNIYSLRGGYESWQECPLKENSK